MIRSTSTRVKRVALALAGVSTLAFGLAANTHADGGDQPRTSATPATMVWLDDLLHPLNIVDAFMVYSDVTSRVGSGDGGQGLSGCTGEERMRDVVGRGAHIYHGVFSGRAGKAGTKFTIAELIADQGTVAQAKHKYATIVRQVRVCQHEPAGHWHYGVAHQDTTSVASTTWMTTFVGNGHRAGGIIVAQTGHHLAVVEAVGAGTPRQVEQLTAGTVSELR